MKSSREIPSDNAVIWMSRSDIEYHNFVPGDLVMVVSLYNYPIDLKDAESGPYMIVSYPHPAGAWSEPVVNIFNHATRTTEAHFVSSLKFVPNL